uniref:Uncharacterized protein n=2 Tax=Clytia hemisphaerica TaxID=252671 RepID=A0A7M6DR77_9CNID
SSALINALLTANNGTLAMGNQNITLSSQPHLAGQNQNTFNFVNNCNNELPAIPAKILKQIKNGRKSLDRIMAAVTPRKRPQKRKFETSELHDLCGYVSFVSGIKIPKNPEKSKAPYFEMYVALENKEERIASWNIDDQPTLLNKLHQGINITGLSKSSDGQGFSFISQTKFMDKRPNFAYVQVNVEPTPLNEALQQPLYSRVTLETNPEVIDNSVNQPREITLYGNLTTMIELNSAYRLSYMTLNKFNGVRVFKASDRTSFAPSINEIAAPMAETNTFTGQVHSVVMSSLATFYKCPHCGETLDSNGSSAMCPNTNCGVGLSTNAIVSVKEIKFTVRSDSNIVRNFKCSHQLVEAMINQSVENKMVFFQKFIDTKVVVTFEEASGDVVSIEETFF